MLLNSIVGEMDKVVIYIKGELFRRESEIPLLKEIEREVVIQENPNPDIKLSAIDEHRFLDVFLDDKGASF